MYIMHYHMVILVSQQCQSLAAKCCHHSWLLNLQVTISHINCKWMRPILLKYKLQLEYCPRSCPWHCLNSLFWISTLTMSGETSLSQLLYVVTLITKQTSILNLHWKMVPDNTCIFAGIAIYGHSDHTTDLTIEFTLKIGFKWYITLVYLLVLP